MDSELSLSREFELLEWDSAFFGFRVARIQAARIERPKLEVILAELRRINVTLVYWNSEPASIPTQQAAIELGGILVDQKVTYAIRVPDFRGPVETKATGVKRYCSGVTNNELISLAIQSGAHSRFRTDPRMDQARFAALYETWIRNCVSGDIAHAVFVRENSEGKIVGMVTVGEKNSKGDIGLIAVAESERGKGIGTELMHGAMRYFRDSNYAEVQVVTQKKNGSACRLYESMGFSPRSEENVFHIWLDGPTSP